MRMRTMTTTLMTLAAALAVTACGAATQQRPTQVATSGCDGLGDVGATVASVYAAGNIEEVKPIYRKEFLARALQPRYVAGAALYVPAQEGMHGAYLQRVLSCHAVGAGDHAADPLRVEGVRRVDVREQGARMRIAISGEGRAAGKAILARARALQTQTSSVSVEQLSAASHGHAF